MVKQKKQCNEFSNSSDNPFDNPCYETDEELSERCKQAERDLLEGNYVDISYLRERAIQLSAIVRKIIESGDIDDDTCYENLIASIEGY